MCDILNMCWLFFNVFIEFVTIFFPFSILVSFGCHACRILAPQPGIKPTSPALEGKALSTGSQGSPHVLALTRFSSSLFGLILWSLWFYSNHHTDWIKQTEMRNHSENLRIERKPLPWIYNSKQGLQSLIQPLERWAVNWLTNSNCKKI